MLVTLRGLRANITCKRSTLPFLTDSFFFFFSLAAICDGHNFPAQYVIHVHSPPWENDSSVENLEKAVKSVLTLADEKNIKSIAIPSIGSGS